LSQSDETMRDKEGRIYNDKGGEPTWSVLKQDYNRDPEFDPRSAKPVTNWLGQQQYAIDGKTPLFYPTSTGEQMKPIIEEVNPLWLVVFAVCLVLSAIYTALVMAPFWGPFAVVYFHALGNRSRLTGLAAIRIVTYVLLGLGVLIGAFGGGILVSTTISNSSNAAAPLIVIGFLGGLAIVPGITLVLFLVAHLLARSARDQQRRERVLAAAVEVILGWAGFMGIGHYLTGLAEEDAARRSAGFKLMAIWMAALLVLGLGSVFSVLCCLGIPALLVWPLYLIFPILSAAALLRPKVLLATSLLERLGVRN
jgi:hypothetical protein